MRLYLASSSPRRAALLRAAAIPFELVSPGPEPIGQGTPRELAVLRARSKAGAVDLAARPPGLVLGVDTVVALGERDLDQPRDAAAARETLRALSGRTHEVWTALCLEPHPARGDRRFEALARALVRFAPLDEARIERHVANGAWRGKAGGYGIQDEGVDFATLVEGARDTVIGLPVATLRELLAHAIAECG